MRNCNHAFVWKTADRFPELWESALNMKTNLVIERQHSYWTQISIAYCLPLTNHDIFLNLVQ